MRLARSLCCSAVALFAMAGPARADDFDGWGDGVAVMQDEEMDDLRGGLAIAPGLEINFGAVVTTYIDGAPALTTQLTWTDLGAFMQQTIGGAGQQLQDMTPDQLAALGLGGLSNIGGVVVQDEKGVTTLAHNVTDGALQNIIINNAIGRDVRQEVDITLELPGFESIQADYLTERLGLRFIDDLNAAPR